MKKYVAIICTFVVICAMSVTAFASGVSTCSSPDCSDPECISITSEENVARAALCPACGGSLLPTYGPWGNWITVSTTKCAHYVYGDDLTQERARKVEFTCNSCSQGYNTLEEQSRSVCNGSNNP